MSRGHWIGVDLDGTLADSRSNRIGQIGAPVEAMAARVRRWLDAGTDVRIVTARANLAILIEDRAAALAAIHNWTFKHFGVVLPVTASKDFAMLQLWDDRAISVEKNTGKILTAGVTDE